MAAQNAAQQIKDRLVDFAAEKHSVDRDQVVFEPNAVRIGNRRVAFNDFIREAYLDRVHLSAAGFYKTPDIHWDRAAGKGRPFYYFAYGAAVSEVSVDTLTGEYHVDRTDILHDVGRSLNPAVDKGQVEGAFVQGMGWLTTEELWWDDKGRLRTHAPSTYKIPLASDRPAIFNVKLADWSENREPTIRRSKAVGEPPLHARRLGPRGALDGGGQRRRLPRMPAARRAGDARAAADGDRPAGARMMAPRPEEIDRLSPTAPRRCWCASRPRAARHRARPAPGCWSPDAAALNTIGGGQLEYLAIDAARALLARGALRQSLDVPARPGDRPMLRRPHPALGRSAPKARRETASSPPRKPTARHCPRCRSSAPATSAGRWPRRWRCCRSAWCWSTSRPDELARAAPGIETILTPLPEDAVRRAPPGSAFVVLTHDHALDFLIAREALARGDAAYVGMIGSRTKRVSFGRWLDEAGPLDTRALVCPIGAAGRPDKRPEVIAAFVAAEIMQHVASRQTAPAAALAFTNG